MVNIYLTDASCNIGPEENKLVRDVFVSAID